jgi:hypothetical protein
MYFSFDRHLHGKCRKSLSLGDGTNKNYKKLYYWFSVVSLNYKSFHVRGIKINLEILMIDLIYKSLSRIKFR